MKASWELVIVIAGISALHVYKATQPPANEAKPAPGATSERIWATYKKDSVGMMHPNTGAVLQARTSGYYRQVGKSGRLFEDHTLPAVDYKRLDLPEPAQRKFMQ